MTTEQTKVVNPYLIAVAPLKERVTEIEKDLDELKVAKEAFLKEMKEAESGLKKEKAETLSTIKLLEKKAGPVEEEAAPEEEEAPAEEAAASAAEDKPKK